MQSLPNEILSIIYLHLSPQTCYQLSLTSKLLSFIFLINRNQLLDRSVESWGCLLFKCPICVKVYLNRESVMCISYGSENLIRVCKKCRKVIKRQNSEILLEMIGDKFIEKRALMEEFPFGNKMLKSLKMLVSL
jgi:hypothetical protein